MLIREIVKALDCQVVCGERHLDRHVVQAFASDLMSDVLTLRQSGIMLITGLANLQTIRTAEIAEFQVILFVRNKKVRGEMLEIAMENDMVILECSYSMFRACGLLFSLGIQPVY